MWPRWLERRDARSRRDRRRADLGCRGISVDWQSIDERTHGARPRRPSLDSPPGRSAAGPRSPADPPGRGGGLRRRRPPSTGRPARPRAIARHATAPDDLAATPIFNATPHRRVDGDGARRSRGRRGRHGRRLGIVFREDRGRSAGSSSSNGVSSAWALRPARPASSEPRAARRRPSPSAAGRSTSTTASRPRVGTDLGFREHGYLILAVTDEDECAGRERLAMQQAEGLARPLAGRG